MTLSLRYAARTDVGLTREGNEDAFYAGPRLLAVADGMGGHAAGEVASRVVIEALAPLDETPPDGDIADGDLTDALRRAVITANGYLRDMVAADNALEGMGTTLTAFLWVHERLGLVHIGDSRAYLLRDGQLEQVTHDHTLVQNLIDQGRITPDEANTHPQRSWITNALDGRPDIDLDLSVRDVRVGDRYLVCSDGLSSYVSEQTIEEAMAASDPQAACDRLVDLALRAGGLDNISCIVAEIVEEEDVADDPILGGAAALGPGQSDPRADSPAARAAAIQSRRPTTAPLPTQPESDAPDVAEPSTDRGVTPDRTPAARTRGSRVILVLGIVVFLVIGGAVATFFYIRTLYYVGVADGTPPTVGVHRGVEGSVLGLHLDSVTDRSNLPITALNNEEQDRVTAGIQADSHNDARRIVAALRGDACARATPSPQPTPSPAKSASTRKRSRHPRATPSPSPSPPPPYCAGTS